MAFVVFGPPRTLTPGQEGGKEPFSAEEAEKDEVEKEEAEKKGGGNESERIFSAPPESRAGFFPEA